MKKHKGLTFTVCIGKYGGLYIYYKKSFRICLGWIAFTIYPYDRELKVEDAFKTLQDKIDDANNN